MKRLAKLILTIVALAVGAGFVASALGGKVDPRVWALPGLLSMTLPFWGIALGVVALLSLILRSWGALVVCVIAGVCGSGGARAFSPFNSEVSIPENKAAFSLLTYNVLQFYDYLGNPPRGYNPTVSAILASGASVVALQECSSLDKPISGVGYTTQQVDSVKESYPYRLFNGDGMGILSRYPVKPIKLDAKPHGTARFAAWSIDVDGNRVDLYSVHLQSFGLNSEDKSIYRELTDGGIRRDKLSEMRHELLPKVGYAMRCHAEEAGMLAEIIKADTCSRIIVCGDFNDVPGSYALTLLQRECGLHGAWANGGFGPTWTYRANRFFFHIDHILYKGFGRPAVTRRLRAGISDHYPVEAVFEM